MANKKTKKKYKAAAADTASRQPKHLQNLTRAKRSWKERAILRCSRSLRMLGALNKSLVSVKPDGILEQHFTNLAFALGEINTIGGVLTLLPDDFQPKRVSTGSRSGVELGGEIKIRTECLEDPIFKFLPAAMFAGAVVVAEDGKQNWLVKCIDGSVRTIRKLYVEPMDAEDAPPADADPDAGELDDEDGEDDSEE